MTAGWGKGFHAGASGKRLIYLLLQRCVHGGAVPHTVQHTRSIPRENRTAILGEVKTSHPCLGRRSICLWELFGVCGLGLCCCRRDSQTFCAGLLVTDYQEKSLWLQGQLLLEILEGEILVLLWAVQAGCVEKLVSSL